MIQVFDERREIAIPGNYAESLQFAIDHFLSQAQQAIRQQNYFAVALAGGSTPKAIYQGILNSKRHREIAWEKVLLFWSDERCVPLDHVDSNYRMAMEAGFNKLPIPPENIFPFLGIGDIQQNALDYEKLILTKIPRQKFDLILLGMGEDGHVASLFPKTHALHVENQLATANFVPEKNVWRMTLTFPCIDAAAQTAVYVFGESKAKTISEVFSFKYQPDLIPAQRVGTAEHKALWVLDNAAASFLKKTLNN